MEWDPANIRALRSALRLPQEKFAFQLGAAPKTVRNWERGQHPPSLALQRALDQTWESASPEQKKRFFACLPPGRKAEAWTAAEIGDGQEAASTSIMDSPVALVGRSVSRPILPPCGFGVERTIPAIERARELAHELWPLVSSSKAG